MSKRKCDDYFSEDNVFYNQSKYNDIMNKNIELENIISDLNNQIQKLKDELELSNNCFYMQNDTINLLMEIIK
tara:strand:+ start:32 stop:250 length:219 start_codon:yes stop_codon:yes gene_type:complete